MWLWDRICRPQLFCWGSCKRYTSIGACKWDRNQVRCCFRVKLILYPLHCGLLLLYKVVSFGLSFVSCAYDQQGTLLNTLANTDGILGLSRAPISLPSQLASHGFINNVIGHCLGTDTNGGYLFLGNDFVPHWRMSWVPMLNAPFLWV